MDRGNIAPWKAEEKELSEKFYKTLQGLALLHPMSDELRKCLSWDMFLKPNQTAFFHVMHYLFRLLDPVEFKRRFFWPITDKKSEANFRSSTVDYLKHLNEKYNLHWANIKSYLVVMPGGMKFINFILEFSSFVVQELIKQREKSLALDTEASQLKDLHPKSMASQNAFMKEYASAYIEELQLNTAMLRDRSLKLRKIFAQIALETNTDEALLLDDTFLEQFDVSNREVFKQKQKAPLTHIKTLEVPLCQLKEDIDKFQTKQNEQKHTKEAMDNALRGIQNLFGAATPPTDGSSKTDVLLSVFNSISETIAEQLDAHNHYNDSNEFVRNELKSVGVELAQVEAQITEVQRNLNARAKEHSSHINVSGGTGVTAITATPLRNLGQQEQALSSKFVFTPPIRREMPSNTHLRLPLLGDVNAKSFESFGNSLLAPAPPRSTRKMRPHDNSSELNTTTNRSKIVDPMQLLRTINNQTKTKSLNRNNLSSLGSKWKQMQTSFGFEATETAGALVSPKRNAPPNSSPFSPLSSSERTRIERPHTNAAADFATNNNSILHVKKNAAVEKVLNASLNVKNLSTSPSGRLDLLVPLQDQQLTPQLKLNDETINEFKLPCSSEENDPNVLSLIPRFKLDLSSQSEDDDLLNISDSVLKDISF